MKIFSSDKLKALLSGVTATAMLLTTAAIMPQQKASAADTCVINTGTEYQIIRGVGGINHPEWTGQDLTTSQRQKAFGNGPDELGFTVLRVFVNPDKNQWNKALATAQTASKMGAYVFASPWEPPSNLAESGGNKGKVHLPKSNYGAYAQHLNDFGNYMKNNGVDLYSISVQNEPDYAHDWTYWSSDETTDFLANYGDKITSTRVMSPETFQYTNKDYYSKILNNQKAMANCDLFATHFYGTQRSQMDFAALESCGKEIWMTEVYVPNSEANSADRWPEALQVAENMHNGFVVGNMSAYVWWYIRRNYGPMKEDGNISKRGYMMAQYSKYVRPEAKRIAATEQPGGNILISAYKNTDGTIAIVAINKGTSAASQTFSMSGGEEISQIKAIRSSGSENLATVNGISPNGSSFTAQLNAQSVTTFVLTCGAIEPDANGYFYHDTFEGSTDNWTGRGAATVQTSGATSYKGSESLLVQGRTSAWNGALKDLNAGAFVPGQEFSFSATVAYREGAATDTFYMKLQYTDANGETQYDSIAEATAVKGEWVQLANTNYKIPEGARNMQVYVETAESTINFYVDEAIGALPGTKIDGPKPVSFVLGDVTCDGVINGFDVAAAKKGLAKDLPSASAKLAADVSQNGKYEVVDVVQIVKFVMGQIDKFTADAQPETPDNNNNNNNDNNNDNNNSNVTVSMAEYTAQCAAKMVEKEPEIDRTEHSGRSYGTLQKVKYYSNTCKRERNFNIILPAGYSTSKKYPVLYAMHGYYQNEDTLASETDESMRLRQIIGNAIASGEAKDMIIVYPYIYASATQDGATGMDDANNRAYDNFINELTNDLMPYIEKNYSVLTGKDNTAITGFSMGGRESLYIAHKLPDKFGYVGAICPAPGVTPGLIAENDYKFTGESPYLLLLTAGSNDQVVYSTPEGYHNVMTKNGVPHIWHYVNGGYHGGNCIRAHMYNFVRFAFKAK